MLCEALRNTGLAGNPDEYFGPMHVERWCRLWQPESPSDYIHHVIREGMGGTSVWGGKVMRLYWGNFIGYLRTVTPKNYSEKELLDAFFPELKFIFITRRDKVRQGVSWLKFIQGMAWYWESDTPQVLPDMEFKPDVIRDFIHQTALHEAAWLRFFQQNGITPKIVVYEDLATRYEATALEVLDFLGIDVQEKLVFRPRKLKRQADGLTEEWVNRYLDLHRESESMGEP